MSPYSYQRRLLKVAIFGCGLLLLNAVLFSQESRIDEETGVEVLARGPVHEAFAEPIVFDPKPGAVVPKAAPQQIEELPPDQRPAGDNVVWISGYWSWDDDRNNFLWVSGFWRALPPGREWVPGYWAEVPGGFQWISGYWANATEDETEYLPVPPATLEAGPSTPAPGPDYFWVPGCWYWRNADYVWRPGYWHVNQPNWIWSPAHYVWTPRGSVFVGGYWDYALPRRGMLFAPVFFNSPFYSRPGFRFSPTMAVNLGILTNHFFIGLGQRHYYFGDYYASSYGSRGFYPWFDFSSSTFGYDPIFAYYQNYNRRTDRNWVNRIRSDYEFRRDHEDARPERVASLSPRIVREDGQRGDGNRPLVQPLSQFAAIQDAQGEIVKLPNEQRTAAAKVAQQTREFTKQRMKTESEGKSGLVATPDDQSKHAETPLEKKTDKNVDRANKELRSTTVKRPKSPIVDVPKADASKSNPSVAPVLPENVKPDSKVKPKAPDKELPAVPKVAPNAEPKRPAQEKPAVPKVEPKPPPAKTPSVPKVEPPKPETPKVEPPPKVRPEVPKTERPPKVRPEVPKVEPPPKVRPEVPRVDPKPPKVSPPPADKPREPKQKPPKREKEPKK